ncbi:MAG: FeoA family protein [Burkholderiaceae bacterium]
MTLDSLKTGCSARVATVGFDGSLRERLAALGVSTGRSIEVIHRLGAGGPLKIRAGRTEMVMRAAEAARIQVETAA